MFFRNKAADAHQDFRKAAVPVFGEDIETAQDQTFQAEKDFPMLAEFASHLECEYFVCGKYREIPFAFYFPLKAYRTERDRKYFHWAFFGSCLLLRHSKYCIPTVYAFTGRPFHRFKETMWLKSPKFRGLSIWSSGTPLTPGNRQTVEELITWVEHSLSACMSAQYALYIKDNTATITFWEPELYDCESQLKLLAEALEELSLD